MERKYKLIIFGASVALGIGIIGIVNDLYQKQPAISSWLAFAGGILLGQAAQIISLVLDLIKDRKMEKSKPKFKIEPNSPATHGISDNIRLLSFKVRNVGGGDSAKLIKIFCTVNSVTQEEYAVKWRRDTLPIDFDIELPSEIQKCYAVNQFFFVVELDHNHAETAELLFTKDHCDLAYFLDAHHTQLKLGRHYTITLKVNAEHMQEHVQKFDIDLTRWDTIAATEIV